MQLYSIDFTGIYPLGSALFLLTTDIVRATQMANELLNPYGITVFEIKLIDQTKEGIVVFLSGDY